MKNSDYCPLKSLNEEIARFKYTNTFTPMLVTNFYAQAACVASELEESRALIEKICEWDMKQPKSGRGNIGIGEIVSSAKFLARRYPKIENTP